ncbi:hypothetical protein IFR05_008220 [Cadophora sp. M221]|nr:hypothetical protein IFR05_008220 [Cadophora sp. M221]
MRSRISECLQDESVSRTCIDLLPFHDLRVIDDPSLYGASVSTIRAHFKVWASNDLQTRLLPGVECPTSEISHPGPDRTPRYSSFLALDENEMIQIDQGASKWPSIKLISSQWDYMSLESTHPLFFAGGEDLDEDDGGWYYVQLTDYLDTYIGLQVPDLPI